MEAQQRTKTNQRPRRLRAHLSCSECRRRKIRCSKEKPCLQCVEGGRLAACQYDDAQSSRRVKIPGQLVFEVLPGHGQPPQSATAGTARPANSGDRTRDREGVEPEDVIPPLRQFWHGSRAGDKYTSPFDGRTLTVPKEVIFGADHATVFWGRTHETNFVPRITDMTTMLLRSGEDNDITTLLEVEQRTRPNEQPAPGMDPELLALVPSRPTAYRLWQIYKEHFNSYYQVLQLPTFEQEYLHFWATQTGPRHFLPQLLSICAIASCFTDQDRLQREAQVRTWIEAVRLWLFKADPRAQMTLGFLQAHLLMLIAGDVHWMKIDRSWISSGTLVRNAISAGLHREPRDFFRVSPFYAELRRKLWYAIMEYDLMTCFAKGRIPSVRDDEYDCGPPEVAWEEFTPGLESGINTRMTVKPEQETYLLLAKFLPLRTRVCYAVNKIQLEIGYDEVLRLDAELRLFVRRMSSADPKKPSKFSQTLSSILSQRAIIALHAPFVIRALQDPKWAYSRTRCLETAASILSSALSLLDNVSLGGDCGPFATINNICRCEVSNSVFLICHELLARAVEQRGLGKYPSPSSLGLWDLQEGQKLADLVKRTSEALERVSKPDLVSQRTCGEAPEDAGALDEDYFHLFFDMNDLGAFD
ncbi:hypothetical protein M406DRAFT_69388 [Cryphonectria parasitica EP155]|uniref:Zn(2)-C6 fungal-type domain-containing protein n=1 Tax=Cryphonectria parasitica (strain ATCC 38755 / EP155) TaxID=660469 RepID=A0A9P5CRF6_CRYP1|nr:uncharacterized protein M406DRAFT_69388 [Cryphonectria parasitica EP155]KAF3767226.1 hypothetical protein M406DRAFT_69388 [Cryphonectria parasitica EP155]